MTKRREKKGQCTIDGDWSFLTNYHKDKDKNAFIGPKDDENKR